MAPGRRLSIGEAPRHSPRCNSHSAQPGVSCSERQDTTMDETSIQQDEIEGFPVLRTKVAGIDLGSESHWVWAPTVDGKGREVQEFGATTPELEKMAAWLKERKVISVAMESTGVYWIPPREVLERHGLEAVLVDARELARVPGRG